MARISISWPEAVVSSTLISAVAGAAVAITALVLHHRRLMAGAMGQVACAQTDVSPVTGEPPHTRFLDNQSP